VKKQKSKLTNVKRSILCLAVVLVGAGVIALWQWNYNSQTKESAREDSVVTVQENAADIEAPADDESQEEPQQTVEPWTVWTTDKVNLRSSGSTEGEILTAVPRHTQLTATGESAGWLQVSYEGQTGYISAAYTTTEEPTTNGYVVCIDPGHQSSGDSSTEPNGPNSSSMKARVTGGTHGTTTGVYEYELTLTISQQLRNELESRGYTVYMTRESHDVNISNMERAQYATSVGADITVRIHANGSDNAAISGALALAPSSGNAYISYLAADSQYLSRCILDSYCAATGMSNQGVSGNDTMTGINWCTMPVTILEMGYMTNASDDVNMENAAFQQQMVQGIANGIDTYFGF
jgi:N-acetylmuramoyl-L-alanine amidase